MATDVVGYGKGDDQRHQSIQRSLLDVLNEAADAAGLSRRGWDRQPSGDGEFAVLPPSESEPQVLDAFVRQLDRVLAHHNRPLKRSARLRLRVAVHVGVVAKAANGYAGQAATQVGRLVDCAPLRRAIETAKNANLALIISDEVHSGTVKQGHTSYTPTDFVRVEVKQKEYQAPAWIHVPAAQHQPDGADLSDPAELTRDPEPTRAAVNEFHGSVSINGGVFGISNAPITNHVYRSRP
ncbi:hypothetical protein ACWEN6_06400 [Sphaerisporangium sp. NPDC004334]